MKQLFQLKYRPLILTISLTILVFFFTTNPLTSPFKYQLALFSFITSSIILIFKWKKGKFFLADPLSIYTGLVSSLFLIGATGWFYSPFFFLLSLYSIFLAFIFPPMVSIGFVVTLAVFFSLNIGDVDVIYDFLVIASLFLTIPLALYLRREYLRLREKEKTILILKKEQSEYKNSIDEILSNKVNNLSAYLREPINNLRLLAYTMDKNLTKEKLHAIQKKAISLSTDALYQLNTFEEEVTNKKLMNTPQLKN